MMKRLKKLPIHLILIGLGFFFLLEWVGVPALAGLALLLGGVVLLTLFSGGGGKRTG